MWCPPAIMMRHFQEKDEMCSSHLSGPGSDLDDFMEDDRGQGPVSSSDPMLSSPAPSTLSVNF